MKVSEARKIVAAAVQSGRITRDEAGRRHVNITRVARNAKRVAIWVDDLIVRVK